MNKRLLGSKKEVLAGEFLYANGIRQIEYNFRCKIGEIDIIGYDSDTLVFFEVKYRSSLRMGYAAEAVNIKKQKTICRVSDYYRMKHNISDFLPMRYDVIAIDNENIDWIENAFMYIPR